MRRRSKSAPPFYTPKSRDVHKGIKAPTFTRKEPIVPPQKKAKVQESVPTVDDIFKVTVCRYFT
jgi:hypothetical protein